MRFSMFFRSIKAFWTSSLAAEMEYRVNFIVAMLTSLGTLAGTIFTLNQLSRSGKTFQGWSLDQALIVVALFTILEGIMSAVLNPNLSRIVQHVQRGTLDFVLLKPLDAQVSVSLRQISPTGFPSIFLGLVLLIYQAVKLELSVSSALTAIVPVIFGVIILYSLWFIVATTTIWFTKVWNATEVLRGFLDAGKYPMSGYPPIGQFFFKFILPVAFLTTVPAETMLGRSHFSTWLIAEGAIAAGLFIGSRIFWKWALRSYTSASS
jgi:ABC-2 type transport system permease protein